MTKKGLKLLRKHVLENYKTYTEFSRSTGLSNAVLSYVINGDRNPSVNTVMKISMETGIDPRLICDDFNQVIEFFNEYKARYGELE